MSNRNSIFLIDPSFDQASVQNCTLLMSLGLDHLSYAIINQETKQVQAVYDEQECEDVVKILSERLTTDTYLNSPYSEIKIAVNTESKINIPDAIFDGADLAAQAQFLPGFHANQLYLQEQKRFELTTIFALPKATELLLREHFPNAKIYTGSLQIAAEHGLVLNFTVGSFQLIYTQHEKLIFEQSYEIADVEEFNYYLLLVLNQLSIDTKKTPVSLSGIIHADDQRYQCLSKYFGELAFLSVNSSLKAEVLEDLPNHYYVNLLALAQ